MEKRREIMSRQRVDDEYMASWFAFKPVSKPAPKKFAAALTPDAAPPSNADPCASRYSERVAFRPATAASKLSPKSFPPPCRARPQVTVYCRDRYAFGEYRGVDLVCLPTIRHKYFDTLAHTFVSTLHLASAAVLTRDAALYCNAANAIFTLLPRIAGIPVALNVDGIERKRKKWNALRARLVSAFRNIFRRSCRTASSRMPKRSAAIIANSMERGFALHPLRRRYRARATTPRSLDQLGLEPGEYFLYVSRLEPENRALEVRRPLRRSTHRT